MKSRKKIKSDICPNCNHPLLESDNFCSWCGQENHNPVRSFKQLLYDFADNNFNFDSKLVKTIYILFLKPGKLTQTYIEGKRQQYVSPTKIYIFASFIFFFILNYNADNLSDFKINISPLKNQNYHGNNMNVGLKTGNKFTPEELDYLSQHQPLTNHIIDSVYYLHGYKKISWFDRKILKTTVAFYSGELTTKEILTEFLKNASTAMFILMPFFAILLYLFHIRKKHFFYNHLIFSVHFHSFVFYVISILILITGIISPMWTILAGMIIISIYFAIAIRTFYLQSWQTSVFKFIVISILYIIILFFSVSATLVFSITFI